MPEAVEYGFLGYLYGSIVGDDENFVSFDDYTFLGIQGEQPPMGVPPSDPEDLAIVNEINWNGQVKDLNGNIFVPFEEDEDGIYQLVIVLQPLDERNEIYRSYLSVIFDFDLGSDLSSGGMIRWIRTIRCGCEATPSIW